MNKRIITIAAIVLLLLAVVSTSVYATGVAFSPTKDSQTNIEATANSKPIFYRLSLEDEKQVKQIVLSDSRIQKLIKGREYVFNVNEHVIKGKEWGLDVGAVGRRRRPEGRRNISRDYRMVGARS